ncbi:ras-specific guanine nucleotide-releasing factor 1 [Patella vulgata]|uniref:ras-specific guanine nucleotide-releasing factor 1 n=1 Tax=Patella vulgata TaxID=6465 RepID=UPI0024A7F805|nr:ras-specific guanine nucleotide-releasing factor 1 [Patella vulgata]
MLPNTMQKGIRINDGQLLYLANKARQENTICGFLYKKSSDTGKWQLRYFVLYQNLLFYFENDTASRPSGVAVLEGSYCDRAITSASVAKGKEIDKQHCFTITYKSEGQRQYDLRCDSESECTAWIDAIKRASYSKVLEMKEELEQKHLHLLQILDSERQAKWQYVQQTDEFTIEVKKLKAELQKFKNQIFSNHQVDEETDEIRKIKKVQSFFRGWLCRRRWKQIVELYIRSPHAESMRKRNSIVFSMVECEEEYNRQLSCLVTCFLRPLRMAASSKKPPVTHEDVNSIFLNSETLLFLHQIFLKGLTARLENWPTLVLGDLFDMLLPMLSIYQEYVRNHHYSLQVLAEYKQKPEFNNLLKRYEEKPACEGRSLELFLTYPMHQIPRYIITLHELLAHTPHDHVERKSLEYAKSKLEELSRVMHDEVSETENIRKNLAIERMIVEGCDILLDVNQTFVRQGPLLQVLNEKNKSNRGRLGSFSSSFKESKKEVVRQVFLFTNHMLLTHRASNGRLHLAKHYGKISLIDCTLVEDPNSDIFFFDEETSSLDSNLSIGSQTSAANLLQAPPSEKDAKADYNGLDFRIIIDSKSGPPITITLVASTLHEKAAWCSDISQCIENLQYSDLLNSSMSESSSVTMPQSVRYIHSTEIWSDPKLFRDDVDIKFSRTLNSCKVPQIRHASVDRLLDRLTDLRFLSIDFLNTFLLTYRVFTTGQTLLEALKRVYKNPEASNLDSSMCSISAQSLSDAEEGSPPHTDFTGEPPEVDSKYVIKPQAEKFRRISTGCMNDAQTVDRLPLGGFHGTKIERGESVDSDDSRSELSTYLIPPKPKLAPIASCETLYDHDIPDVPSITMEDSSTSGITLSDFEIGESSVDTCDSDNEGRLAPPLVISGAPQDFSETLMRTSHYTLSSAASSDTLTPGTPQASPIPSPLGSPKRIKFNLKQNGNKGRPQSPSAPCKMPDAPAVSLEALTLSPASSPIRVIKPLPTSSPIRVPSPKFRSTSPKQTSSPSRTPRSRSPSVSPKLRRAPSPISYSYSSPNIIAPQIKIKPYQVHLQQLLHLLQPLLVWLTTLQQKIPKMWVAFLVLVQVLIDQLRNGNL